MMRFYYVAVFSVLAIANLTDNRLLLMTWFAAMALQFVVWGVMTWRRTGLGLISFSLTLSGYCFLYYAAQALHGISFESTLFVMVFQAIVAIGCYLVQLRMNPAEVRALHAQVGSSGSLWAWVSGTAIPKLR